LKPHESAGSLAAMDSAAAGTAECQTSIFHREAVELLTFGLDGWRAGNMFYEQDTMWR